MLSRITDHDRVHVVTWQDLRGVKSRIGFYVSKDKNGATSSHRIDERSSVRNLIVSGVPKRETTLDVTLKALDLNETKNQPEESRTYSHEKLDGLLVYSAPS